MREYSGDLSDCGGHYAIAIVAARFNRRITEQLLAGAERALGEHGIAPEDIVRVWVPGAFEIPLACKKLIETPVENGLGETPAGGKHYDAIITLGAVIRGETPHFDYVAGECARGVASLSLASGVPISFGVLTTDNVEQAQRRADPEAGNKGAAAALAALEMAALLRQHPA